MTKKIPYVALAIFSFSPGNSPSIYFTENSFVLKKIYVPTRHKLSLPQDIIQYVGRISLKSVGSEQIHFRTSTFLWLSQYSC